MPNIKSAEKRVEVTAVKNALNKSYRTQFKTAMKKFDAAIAENNAELAESLLSATMSEIDSACTKGVIHKNSANRRKAAVSKKLAALKK